MRKFFYFLLIVTLIGSCTEKANKNEKTKLREDIASEYKWDLSSLCEDSLTWANGCKEIEREIEGFRNSELTIVNPEDLFGVLYKQDSIYNELLRLYLFAMMQEHVDFNNEPSQKMRMQMDILESNFLEAFSVVEPSVLEINPSKIKKWIADFPKLKQYDFYINHVLQSQEHVPSKEQSQILSNFSLVTNSIQGIYEELFYSDLNEPDYDRHNPDRNERLKRYHEYINFYASKRNTVAAIIVSDLQLKYAHSKSKGYTSILEEDLNQDKVPIEFYHSLLAAVKSGSETLQKYHSLRAEKLKLDDYQPADMGYNIFPSQVDYSYDKAKIIIKNALQPLGSFYQDHLDEMLNNNKIDVLENEGKLDYGAYVVSVFGKTPFILTNYEKKQEDINILIHELGHAVHAMFSMEHQPLSKYEPSIIKDEIASTFNELLLIDYLLENASSSRQKLHVLETAIDNMEYYFRQSLITDFVYGACSAIESGEAVTASYLDTLYVQTYKNYYGTSITNLNPSEWTKYRVLNYYIYKYVLSMTASLVFHESIKNGKESEIERYLDFLEMGGNDYPLVQLKKVGINLKDDNVLNSIGEYTAKLVDMYEKELIKVGDI